MVPIDTNQVVEKLNIGPVIIQISMPSIAKAKASVDPANLDILTDI